MHTNSPLWILRLIWAALPLAFVPLLSAATSSLGTAGTLVVAVGAWLSWAAILLAAMVPSTVSLTVGRLTAPLTLWIVVVCLVGPEVAGWKLAVAAAASALATLVWFSGESGGALVQGSAYGAEERFPLKPPVPFVVPMAVFWLLMSAGLVVGMTLLANESWIGGVPATAASLALAGFLGPRFHQLSRRWLVVVPVGLVVHDPMLLVENALFRTSELRAIHLAPADTEAADLTGGTAGVAVEIVLREMDTVVKVGSKDKPTGVALHVQSVLVSPTRPGRALAAAANRKLPVG